MIDFFLISYLFTGEIPKASGITVVFSMIQILSYYLHERAWLKWKNIRSREFLIVFAIWACVFGTFILLIS